MFSFLKKKKGGNVRVSVRNLVVSRGNKKIICGLSFNVSKGQIYGVVGLSGSGKSTVLKSLVGLLLKQGYVKLFGCYGYCPQEDAFFEDLTVKENLVLFGSLSGVQEEKVLKKGVVLLKQLLMFDKLDSVSSSLSGGQKKRLNIILSILHSPKIIILDEPFAGLDYYNRKVLWSFLRHLKNTGYTILLTTHLLNEAEDNCSEVLVLKNGKKFAAGSVKQILKRRGVDVVISLRTNYVNKDKEEDIKIYCKRNKVRVLELKKNSIILALSYVNKGLFYSFLSRKKIVFEEVFSRVPELDDVFLMSVENV
ncbi:MAG: ABC transporter ATP-binding protein [Nanoarchaeota archaeon]|nr:ABC transporter ATP-binding protein [Nanoarchaeota archaeon]